MPGVCLTFVIRLNYLRFFVSSFVLCEKFLIFKIAASSLDGWMDFSDLCILQQRHSREILPTFLFFYFAYKCLRMLSSPCRNNKLTNLQGIRS